MMTVKESTVRWETEPVWARMDMLGIPSARMDRIETKIIVATYETPTLRPS